MRMGMTDEQVSGVVMGGGRCRKNVFITTDHPYIDAVKTLSSSGLAPIEIVEAMSKQLGERASMLLIQHIVARKVTTCRTCQRQFYHGWELLEGIFHCRQENCQDIADTLRDTTPNYEPIFTEPEILGVKDNMVKFKFEDCICYHRGTLKDARAYIKKLVQLRDDAPLRRKDTHSLFTNSRATPHA